MTLFLCLVILNIFLAQFVDNRGPHHPRGEVSSKHTHYRPTKDSTQKLTQDAELLHDKEHIQEHLDEVVNELDLSNLTNEQLEFYYFQVHDTDKNLKLDGLEMLQAIIHTVHEDDQQIQQNDSDFDYYVEIVDQALKDDDIDQDGFLSYPEFIAARKKSTAIENSISTTTVGIGNIKNDEVVVDLVP